MKNLDLDFIRSHFPALSKEWVFMDNAGGSQTVKQVGERINDYLYNSNVQLGATYDISKKAGARVLEAQKVLGELINVTHTEEVVLGPSTTQLLHNLSKSMVQTFSPGDEVIVTNCDHEANIGPWINMEKSGIKVKFWNINPETLELDLDVLDKLMTYKTRLVAFTHASNILGTINPVKEITKFVHNRGAMVCVDGVAYAPHRHVDVQDLDVDFYTFSFYKVYGPHYSLLYVKKKHLERLPGINHFFIGNNEGAYKLQPGNVNYELSYGLLGVTDYIKTVYEHHHTVNGESLNEMAKGVFKLFAEQEEKTTSILIDFLKGFKSIRFIGKVSADKNLRVPTISFISDKMKSSEITPLVDKHKIAIRYGDFYARRLINDIGLAEKDGVIRISLVHYNTDKEVNSLFKVLDAIL